jgi:hypothetical protein
MSEILHMTERIKLVRNDTGPQIKLTLTNELTDLPIDLTGASVTLHFRAVDTETVLFSRPAFINPATASQGICIIEWAVGNLNVEAGDYEGEIEVVLSSGLRETIFSLLKFRVREELA